MLKKRAAKPKNIILCASKWTKEDAWYEYSYSHPEQWKTFFGKSGTRGLICDWINQEIASLYLRAECAAPPRVELCSISILSWPIWQRADWHTDDEMVARGNGAGMALFCLRSKAQTEVSFKRTSRTSALSFEYTQGKGYLVLDDWFRPGQHQFYCPAGRVIVRVGFCEDEH